VDGHFVRGIPDFFLAHDFSFPGVTAGVAVGLIWAGWLLAE
jgi:hypothetical protein